MMAHSDNMPRPRGALTLQQFRSGVPARDWNTIVWCDASRTPSIGVLYVHQNRKGAAHRACHCRSIARVHRQRSSRPSARSASTVKAIQAIVQQVSMAVGSYGVPVACSPDENPPVLRRSSRRILSQ